MEGDAGSGQLTPTPASTDDDASRSDAEESVNQASTDDDASRSEVEESVNQAQADDDASRSEVEESGVDDEVAQTGEDVLTSARSRLATRGWLVAVLAALLVVTAAVGTGGYLALRSHQKSEAAARAEVAALAAAKDCVTATQAPDATAMADSQRKIIDCATGDFGAQATLYSGVLVEAYQAANAKVEVTNMRSAVERHNPDGSIDVLVAVRVKVSNSQIQGQEQGYRLRVRMMPDNGVYKIARLDQVSK